MRILYRAGNLAPAQNDLCLDEMPSVQHNKLDIMGSRESLTFLLQSNVSFALESLSRLSFNRVFTWIFPAVKLGVEEQNSPGHLMRL